MTSTSSHRFSYLDLENIEGGWGDLFYQVPDWITTIRKERYAPLEKEIENKLIIGGHRDEVIRRNLRFVTNLSRHYLREGVEAWDIIAAGNIGLIEAYDKFDPTRDTKFITYAVNLIRAKMIDELRGSNNVKLSSTQLLMLHDFMFHGDLETMIDKRPDRYGATYDTLSRNLEELLSILRMVRIDAPFEDGSMMELTSGTNAPAFSEDEKQVLATCLKSNDLTLDEHLTIVGNFGLVQDVGALSIRKLAAMWNVPVSRVATMRTKAIQKLKADPTLREMFEGNVDKTNISYASSKGFSDIE